MTVVKTSRGASGVRHSDKTIGCRVDRQRCPVAGTSSVSRSPKLKWTSCASTRSRKVLPPAKILTCVTTGSVSM
jgi:hypothetical protein